MLCSACGSEIGDAVDCAACRAGATTGRAPTHPSSSPPSRKRSAIFSAGAWLELRVRSVFATNPRGFSQQLGSGTEKE
jgi:hypothetical protein